MKNSLTISTAVKSVLVEDEETIRAIRGYGEYRLLKIHGLSEFQAYRASLKFATLPENYPCPLVERGTEYLKQDGIDNGIA